MPSAIKQSRAVIANHGPALIAGVVVLLGFIWMITYGTFQIFEPEHFGQFYDAQASALLAGHWDVPREAIFPEGFYRDGKAYGYFGFVPALPRMVLNHFMPGMTGAWSRLSAIIACAITLACCCAILRRARPFGDQRPNRFQKFACAAFLLAAGLGSTVIFLGSRAFIYHEAILWAVALALVCYVQLFDYLATGRRRHLIAACMLAWLCFFTRISSGLGPMLALLLLGTLITYRSVKSRSSTTPKNFATLPDSLLIGVTLVAIILTYVAVNHAKFGTYFQPAPMWLHEQIALEPSRLTRTGGQWMSPGNIPTTAYAYLSPTSIRFRPEFPWIFLCENLRLFPGQRLDGSGTFCSLTTSMPAFVILAVLGLGIIAVRRPLTYSKKTCVFFGMLLFGSLAPIIAVLAFSNVESRYLHEFFPLLIMASAFGLNWLVSLKKTAVKSILMILLLLGGEAQIYANCAYALVYQRLLVFDAPPGPATQFRHWQREVDGIISSR